MDLRSQIGGSAIVIVVLLRVPKPRGQERRERTILILSVKTWRLSDPLTSGLGGFCPGGSAVDISYEAAKSRRRV